MSESPTWEEAEQLMREAEEAFAEADVDRILQMFTPDVVVRYADFPEIRGRQALAEFLRARFARQRNYRPQKSLRVVQGDLIVDSFEGIWEDAVTGEKMRGRGIEIVRGCRGKPSEGGDSRSRDAPSAESAVKAVWETAFLPAWSTCPTS